MLSYVMDGRSHMPANRPCACHLVRLLVAQSLVFLHRFLVLLRRPHCIPTSVFLPFYSGSAEYFIASLSTLFILIGLESGCCAFQPFRCVHSFPGLGNRTFRVCFGVVFARFLGECFSCFSFFIILFSWLQNRNTRLHRGLSPCQPAGMNTSLGEIACLNSLPR